MELFPIYTPISKWENKALVNESNSRTEVQAAESKPEEKDV